MVAAVMFYAAVGLAAGSVLPGVPAILAVSLGILFLVPTLAGLLPFDVSPYLPTSILDWTVGFAAGQDVGFDHADRRGRSATVALIVFSIRQMERIEL